MKFTRVGLDKIECWSFPPVHGGKHLGNLICEGERWFFATIGGVALSKSELDCIGDKLQLLENE